MKKIIGYIVFAVMYRIGCIFPADVNRYFCVMTHDGSSESSVGVVIAAIRERNPGAVFTCLRKEDRTGIASIDLMLVKPFMMARSKTILMDNEFLPLAYVRLRKGVKVVQLWHGTGTVKKFGHDISGGRMLDIVSRADSKITHLIVNSEYTRKLYSHVFGVAPDKVYVTGIPKDDMLFDGKRLELMRNTFFREYRELEGKKLVLYAPTFRDEETRMPDIRMDFDEWLSSTDDGTILMLRLHPHIASGRGGMRISKYKGRIVDMSGYGNLNTLLSVSDVLITDYSSIIFEYIVFNRPILFYAYDLERFENDGRGFYEDYRSYVPGPVVTDTKSLVHKMNDEDNYAARRKEFLDEAYEYKDGKSTDRVLDLILSGGTYETFAE